jgi:hypothetical protein
MTMTPGAALVQEDVDPYTYRRRIERDGMRALVLVDPTTQAWAVVGHQVAGWHCLATGTAGAGWSPETVADDIARHYGDGFARIPRDYYRLTHPDALNVHQLRSLVPGEIAAYCGVPAATPYVYKRGRYYQHCVDCTRIYRAEHYGRCPIEEH